MPAYKTSKEKSRERLQNIDPTFIADLVEKARRQKDQYHADQVDRYLDGQLIEGGTVQGEIDAINFIEDEDIKIEKKAAFAKAWNARPEEERNGCDGEVIRLPSIDENKAINEYAQFLVDETTKMCAFIRNGNIYVFDLEYFGSGTNVIAHLGVSINPQAPDERHPIVAKFLAGNIEKMDDGSGENMEETFVAMDTYLIMNGFADAQEYNGIGLDIAEIPISEEHLHIIFGDKLVEQDGKLLKADEKGNLIMEEGLPIEIDINSPFIGILRQSCFLEIQQEIPGIELEDLIKSDDYNKLSPAEKLALGIQVVQAIQQYQKRGAGDVFHRDIRPGNLMVDMSKSPPQVRVIDFTTSSRQGSDAKDMGLTVYAIPEGDATERDTYMIKGIKHASYTHPDIVDRSQSESPDNFEAGTLTAVKIKYEAYHEAYSIRKVLRNMGIDIPINKDDRRDDIGKILIDLGVAPKTNLDAKEKENFEPLQLLSVKERIAKWQELINKQGDQKPNTPEDYTTRSRKKPKGE